MLVVNFAAIWRNLPVFLLLLLLSLPASAKHSGLKLGILPSENPVTMFKRLAPLREYLTLHLRERINLETARDFQQFIERSAAGSYDILLTAPHLALLAHDSGKYDVIASFYRPLTTVFVVAKGSHIHSLKELKGARIAAAPEQAIVTMVGRETLRPVVDLTTIQFQYHRNHTSAFYALRGGEADVAMVANLIYRINRHQMPLRVIGSSHDFPGIGVLVLKSKSAEFKARLSDILTHMRESTDGLVVLKKINQPGYSAATIEQFEVLRPYLKNL